MVQKAISIVQQIGKVLLNQKEDFAFTTRNRRPPLDNINALLSFAYTILAGDCANALSSVGLDPYVGFMHGDRSEERRVGKSVA